MENLKKKINEDEDNANDTNFNANNEQQPKNCPSEETPPILNNHSVKELKKLSLIKIGNQPKPVQDGKFHGLNLNFKELKKKPEPGIENTQNEIIPDCENTKIKNPNDNQTNIEDPDRDFVNEYNAFVARIEGNGTKPTMTGKERIQARIQQKLMILEHESQILRDNLFIVTKQKEEMIQTYEKHIKEIEKQNQKLFEENEILKKKIEKS